VAPSTCCVQSLASYLLRLAVSWARGAIGVQLAVVGFLLTWPRSQLGSWRHWCADSSRWLHTYMASQSAGFVAPSTCGMQSLASYILRLAFSWACGAIDVQLAVVGFLLTMQRSQLARGAIDVQ